MIPVFLFPGQSSRDPDMFDRLRAWAPIETDTVLEEARDVLGRDVATRLPRPDGDPASNRDVQVGVFLANEAHRRAVEALGLSAPLSAGLSLGEYNHLVHIGALEFADALRLVEARGEAYDLGPEGAMASVFPLSLDELRPVVERAREGRTLEIVNLNAPLQNVIAGDADAVLDACERLEADLGCSCVVLERRLPMHASSFAPVARTFRLALERAPFRAPELPYLPNVTARPVRSPSPADFVDLLARHVHSPVRFRDTVEHLVADHEDAVFIEVGPKAVLYNLLSRKWIRNARHRTDAPGAARAIAALAEEAARAA